MKQGRFNLVCHCFCILSETRMTTSTSSEAKHNNDIIVYELVLTDKRTKEIIYKNLNGLGNFHLKESAIYL